MAADVNVTEKVARAVCPSVFDPRSWPPATFGQSVEEARAEWRQDAMDDARRALSALADPEVQAGIAGVLREHGDSRQSAGGFLLVCRCGEAVDDHGAHQARAVVEWLRGRA